MTTSEQFAIASPTTTITSWPATRYPQVRGRIQRRVARVLGACLVAAVGSLVWGQTDDFNDGNDSGWTRWDLTEVGLSAAFSFPTVGPGNQAYRIQMTPVPAELASIVGSARAASYRSTVFSDRFQCGADLVSWSNTIDQAFGLLGRVSNVGLGTTTGYVMNMNPTDKTVEITAIDQEQPRVLSTSPCALVPATSPYRMVLTGAGPSLIGLVYQHPDLANPIASVVAQDSSYSSGKAGLLIFDDSTTGADATFDNYSASTPTQLRPTVVQLRPTPNQATTSFAMGVGIIDGDTAVRLDNLQVWVDGQLLAPVELTMVSTYTQPGKAVAFPGADITWTVTTSNWEGPHTNQVVFEDSEGVWQTNIWTYTYSYLKAANARPVSAGKEPGFSVRWVQTLQGQPLANSLERAERQLALPPEIPIDNAATTTVLVINFTQQAPPGTDGHFPDDMVFPGLDPLGNTDDFAVEILAYLQLTPGIHTFGVISDDGFQLRSGASFRDPQAAVLGEKLSGTYNGRFPVLVEKEGLYPFRMVYFERGGGAHLEWFWVNPDTGQELLINDPDCPIKAFATLAPTLVVESTPALGTPFTLEPSANVDMGTWTITVTPSGEQRFYRILSDNIALEVKSVNKQPEALVIEMREK